MAKPKRITTRRRPRFRIVHPTVRTLTRALLLYGPQRDWFGERSREMREEMFAEARERQKQPNKRGD